MKLSPAIPILRIFSKDKAKEFYLDFLGFSRDWEHQSEAGLPLYARASIAPMSLRCNVSCFAGSGATP